MQWLLSINRGYLVILMPAYYVYQVKLIMYHVCSKKYLIFRLGIFLLTFQKKLNFDLSFVNRLVSFTYFVLYELLNVYFRENV